LVSGRDGRLYLVRHVRLTKVGFGQSNQEPATFHDQFFGTALRRLDALDPVVDGDNLLPQCLISSSAPTQLFAQCDLGRNELFRSLFPRERRATPREYTARLLKGLAD
jgi:hypothetical protein